MGQNVKMFFTCCGSVQYIARVEIVWAPDPSLSHARTPHNRMRLYEEGSGAQTSVEKALGQSSRS